MTERHVTIDVDDAEVIPDMLALLEPHQVDELDDRDGANDARSRLWAAVVAGEETRSLHVGMYL